MFILEQATDVHLGLEV